MLDGMSMIVTRRHEEGKPQSLFGLKLDRLVNIFLPFAGQFVYVHGPCVHAVWRWIVCVVSCLCSYSSRTCMHCRLLALFFRFLGRIVRGHALLDYNTRTLLPTPQLVNSRKTPGSYDVAEGVERREESES